MLHFLSVASKSPLTVLHELQSPSGETVSLGLLDTGDEESMGLLKVRTHFR